jgi:hypothetical protein
MGFVPEGAKWFLAQILLLTEFEGREESELQISWRLVRADTVDDAYNNAIRHGRERELTYTNIYNEKVTIKFVGLQDLDVIHDPLEDGAELAFEVVENPSSSEIASRSKAKHELSLFTPPPTLDITPPTSSTS